MQRKKLIAVRIVLIVLTVAVMSVIFMLSADTADESNEKSVIISDTIVYKILSRLNLTEEQLEKTANAVFVIVRKAAHFTEYAGLGFLLASVCVSFYRKRLFTVLFSQITGSLYAVSDEVHQYFVPGRSCQAGDVLIDSCGVFFGAVFLLFLCFLYFKIKNKKQRKIDN